MRIVISQPMFFPWSGLFEQVASSDTFIHYDDVQLPNGRSFMTRVQIKTSQGIIWLTVPVKRKAFQLISEAELDDTQPWRETHIKTLQSAYGRAPFFKEMIALVEEVYSAPYSKLADLNVGCTEAAAKYLGLTRNTAKSSTTPSSSRSTQRLLDLVQLYKGTTYLTGHGAAQYMDHDLFEASSIAVEYMQYSTTAYVQMHPPFTPYVSILDAIANLGKECRQIISPKTIPWRSFLESNRAVQKRSSDEHQIITG